MTYSQPWMVPSEYTFSFPYEAKETLEGIPQSRVPLNPEVHYSSRVKGLIRGRSTIEHPVSLSYLTDGETSTESVMHSQHMASRAAVGWERRCPNSQNRLSVDSPRPPSSRRGWRLSWVWNHWAEVRHGN